MDSYKLQPDAKSQLQPITTVLSEFNQFRRKGYLFVDKTALINDLIYESRVFLSRPRRFGKSLLLSTIAELFTNGVKNFEGLAIHDMWQRDRYPVVELSFLKAICARDCAQPLRWLGLGLLLRLVRRSTPSLL